MAPKKGNRQLLARALGGGAGGNLVVPADFKRAQELYAQFKKGKKRARAQEEAEAMYLAGANSALCIALAKMHMTLAVEQALKLDGESAREAAVLASLHAALQYAVTGAVQFHSIQCVVLCVFTLHCCRGRGTAEQKAQRQGWHAQLSDALPAGDKAKWAAVGWVDPRLESHATQDRFGFEWNQRGQHPTVEAWAEAVRDDWTKFMHKARVADTIDFKLLERLPTKNPESLRELLHEVEQPVDRRLAGNVTPLNNADKEALKQRLDALDAQDARRAAVAAGAGGGAGLSGSSSTGSKAGLAAAAAAPAPAAHHSHQSLTNQWLPALHTAQLNKQKQKAEHKRLVEAQARAQQRAALIREYLALKFDPNATQPAEGGAPLGDAQLAASASLMLRELQAAATQLAASRDLSAAEAELANANLALLMPAGSAADAPPEGSSGGERQRRHVWYGDPLLNSSDSRHSVAGYSEMERLLVEHQRQDWSMFEYAGQLVCRDVEGWQAVVAALPVKPVLLREPCPDLLLDRFGPDPAGVDARLYSADLSLLDGSAGAATAGDELDGGASDDDDFSDALSRQASLGASDCGELLPTARGGGEQPPREAEPPATPAPEAPAPAPAAARRSGKPLLQRVMQALKQQGHLDSPTLQQHQQQQQHGDGNGSCTSARAGQPASFDAPAAAEQQPPAPQQWRGPLPHGAEDLHSLFTEHHAREWMPRVAASWGFTHDQGCRLYQQWAGEGAEAGQLEFLARLADAAKHAWLKDVLDAQLASGELPPETAAALERVRSELWLADAKQKERQPQPPDFLRKKRQRSHDGAAPLDAAGGGPAVPAAAVEHAPPSPLSDTGSSGSSDPDGSSSGISWRSGSTGGSSLAHRLSGVAATDILDSYMRELLHNTIPCLDAVLGLYGDAQAECAARLLPEDRLGEARVEQMVRRGFAGHCMVQLIFGLEVSQAPRHALSATMGHLADILAGAASPEHIMWSFVTSERAAGEVGEAYQQLLELERRSQGRVMSRPVSACTRMLAPLLLQDWEHLKSDMAPDEFLHSLKCRLARMTLAALRQLHRRGRLMEGVLWQLNSYILNCLEKAGEAAVDGLQQEELGKLWEELADVAHDNQDCFNYAAHLPLRMMLPLYTFVAMLCAEAFRCAADVAAELEDVAVADASVAQLSEDGSTLVLSPRAVGSFVAAAAEAAMAAPAEAPAMQRKGAASRPLAGGSGAAPAPDRCALLADYASGLTEVQRAMQRLQSGGLPYQVGLGAGLLGLTGGAAAAVAAAGSAAPGDASSAADLAERSRLCQQLHRLLYAEAVLGTLFQRCEDISDGLEATSQVLRFMAKGLDEFIAGTLSEPLPPAPPLHVEQQLRDAQYALAAADCAQLALMLSNERLRALCYADTLAALREEQAAAGGCGGQQQRTVPQQQGQAGAGNGTEVPEQAGEPGSIAAAVERFSRLHADMQEESRHDRAALQQLASSLASPGSIPLLKSVDLENVAIVDSVLQFAQNIGNVSQPSLQPAIEQYRSILADKQAEAHERLEQVKAYVVAASRQLEHQRSQLGVLLEWCRIRQMSIIGQLRAGFCAHSALDQLADLAVRAAAVLRWEPELRQLQEQERQANMLALQRELEAEQAEAEKRAARAEKRKAQKCRKAAAAGAEAPHANGVGNGDADSTSGSDSEAAPPAPLRAQEQQQQQQQQQQAQQESRRQATGMAQPPTLATTGGKAAGKGGSQHQSQQAAAYQRMLEEFGLDAEAASFAQQLAARQATRTQDGAQPPASKQQQQTGGGSPAGKGLKAASSQQQQQQAPAKAVVVVAKRPSSAPVSGGSNGAGGGADPVGSGGSGLGSNTVLAKPAGARELMRVVGYYGDWLCFCGEVNKLWDTCSCGQTPPCRDWVRGICKYADTCRFSHPPFDLPDGSSIPMSDRIAKPAPDAPLYRKGQVVLPAAARQQAAKAAAAQRRPTSAAVVPAVPAVNAWQRPLQAALQPYQQAGEQQQQQQQPLPSAQQHIRPEVQLQQQLAALPPPPPPASGVGTAAAAALAGASESAAAHRSEVPLLSGGLDGGSSGALGWHPIGSFDLGGGSGLGTPTVALASADSSRAATPALGDGGTLAAASAGAVFPFPAAGSSLQGGLAAAAASQQWEQRNGSLGSASGGLGPTGDESSFLSQLMQGLGVGTGEEPGDADLASLLGPIAADVGGVGPPAPGAGAAPLGGPTHSQPLAVPPASPDRPAVGPWLLDGLAAAHQQQPQPAAGGPLFAGFAGDVAGGSAAAMAAAGRSDKLLGALLACLWHCAAFRQLVLTWPEIVHKADPVVHALHRSFLAYGGAAAAPESAKAPAHAPAAAASAGLADTLAGQLFGAGQLGDAVEVLGGVYSRIREVESMRGIPSGVDQCFGLGLTEGVQCAACGKVTRQAHYTQHFVTVHAVSLLAAAAQLADAAGGQAPPLGQLLRLVEDQSVRTCDASAGGCGAPGKLLQLLERPPRVVALHLSWESHQPAGADVRATMAAAGERLDLSHLYLGPHPSSSMYRLGAMLCYTPQSQGGTCCQAFLFDTLSSCWLATPVDQNAELDAVGNWAALLQKVAMERIQPSLLFYMAHS